MKDLRVRCVAFLAWMFFIHNADKLHEVIRPLPFVEVFAVAAALPVILLPRIQRLALPWLLVPPASVLLLLKAGLNHPIGGAALPATVTELCLVGITVAIARWAGRGFEEVHNSLASVVLDHVHRRSRPFESGQEEMYRETRRCRIHQRPLALMVVSPGEANVKVSMDRFVRQVADNIAQDYSAARIAELLSAEMKDCDTITQRDGHFVILMPETGRDAALQTIQRLEATAKEKLGLDLKFGLSVFPDEEITFVGLLERAERNVSSGSPGHAAATPGARPLRYNLYRTSNKELPSRNDSVSP